MKPKLSTFSLKTYETVDQLNPFCFFISTNFSQKLFFINSFLDYLLLSHKVSPQQVSLNPHHSLYFYVLFTKIKVPRSSLHINNVNSTLGTTSIYPNFFIHSFSFTLFQGSTFIIPCTFLHQRYQTSPLSLFLHTLHISYVLPQSSCERFLILFLTRILVVFLVNFQNDLLTGF